MNASFFLFILFNLLFLFIILLYIKIVRKNMYEIESLSYSKYIFYSSLKI